MSTTETPHALVTATDSAVRELKKLIAGEGGEVTGVLEEWCAMDCSRAEQ